MQSDSYTIGVLGGMGTYATIHLFRQYAALFPAEKEWERPRIIIDNRCTMPSRVRAYLYGEDREQLVEEMADSVQNLIGSGCDRILIGCNTAHLFLPDIYRKVPRARGKIVNIIEACAEEIAGSGVEEVYLLASEGTIESGIYQSVCAARGIRCIAPEKEEYGMIRTCIEAVKQNRDYWRVRPLFLHLTWQRGACILGCTELPVLEEKFGLEISGTRRLYDPVRIALKQLREEYLQRKQEWEQE